MKRLSNFELSEFLLKNNIKSDTKLFAQADILKHAGKMIGVYKEVHNNDQKEEHGNIFDIATDLLFYCNFHWHWLRKK